MIWVVIGLLITIIIFLLLSSTDSYKEQRDLNLRIDGIQERIDGLRDMLMQKIENDYQQLKKDIRK